MLSKKKQEKIIVSFSIKIKLILELALSVDRFGCFSWNRPDHYAYAYHLCIFVVFYFFMEDSIALSPLHLSQNARNQRNENVTRIDRGR